MRRQDIQLMRQARQGDPAARCEVGRRYLLGVQGFARHVGTGLAYLGHASLAQHPAPAQIVAECLPLEELLQAGLTAQLALAAAAGSAVAQLKQAAWCRASPGGQAEGRRWLAQAVAGGHPAARLAQAALAGVPDDEALARLLPLLAQHGLLDAAQVARLAVVQALAATDLAQLVVCLRAALALADTLDAPLAESVVAAALLAQSRGQVLQGLPAEGLRNSLEQCAARGHREAAFLLGRAAAGLPCEALPAEVFAEHQNLRKGAAFLLRAADAGCDEAWLHLVRLHSDHRSSVANPQLARFFLEKAAACGQAEAQRKLGALTLRESVNLVDTEQAIVWLNAAAAQRDGLATTLLQSLVLPVDDVGEGSDDASDMAITQVRQTDPALAMRLALGRAFGLTKLEALTVDPVDGQRAWGLVVGKNPFISQVRLSAPRAVPACHPGAAEVLQRAVAYFAQARGDGGAAEGDLRARSLRQRRVFERLGLPEGLFFADASSMTLETLRQGAKWAFRARQTLSQALAA